MSLIAAFALLAAPLVAAAGDPPIVTKSGPIGDPAPGQGQVVFFRPGSIVGLALGCGVRDERGEVARLGPGRFSVVALAPGRHDFHVKGMGGVLPVTLGAGETRFVRCAFGKGVVQGRAELTAATRAEFAQKAAKLKRAE